jgi:hypothetical protein
MAAESDDTTLSLKQGDNDVPAITKGETGYSGLVTLGGKIWDQCNHELIWPQAYHTFKKMALDGAVHPSLDFVETKIAEATWKVRIPKGYEKELKEHAKFLDQVKDDMDHSWTQFIQNAATFNRYGFSVVEKVFRYRNKVYGSKFDDGLWGLKRLPIRGQGTIQEWDWRNSGRDLDGFWQRCVVPIPSADKLVDMTNARKQEYKVKWIPRKKFILFRHNPQDDSPQGTSPLTGVWQAWKMKQAFQEAEAIGTAQDNNAFKILYLPPEYLVDDADEDRKKSYELYQKMMENAHQAKSSGFILPMLLDADGKKMFDFELKNISGGKSYDVNIIIQRYTKEIQVGLFTDVLSLGSGGGSYSLAESKVSFANLAVKSRLTEIKDQLNHDLVPQLFALNGWPTDVMPYFDFDMPDQETMDNKGKFYQRVKAVGLLPIVPATINQVLKDAGIDYYVPDDMSTEELMKLLGTPTSEAGGGMKSGLNGSNGSGTGKSGDSSTGNKENS